MEIEMLQVINHIKVRWNVTIEKNFKITIAIKEVLNFFSDDNVDVRSKISEDNCTNTVSYQFSIINECKVSFL